MASLCCHLVPVDSMTLTGDFRTGEPLASAGRAGQPAPIRGVIRGGSERLRPAGYAGHDWRAAAGS